MNLGERYAKVNYETTQYNKLIENKNKICEELNEDRLKFRTAIEKLNANVRDIKLINNNVCVLMQPGYWTPIYIGHFKAEVSDKEKKQAYCIIRKNLRKLAELNKGFHVYDNATVEMFHKYSAKNTITELDIKFLYELTGGNKDTLVEIAKLCAMIIKKGIRPVPTVILADKKIHTSLKHFIECITGEVFPDSTLNDFLENQKTLYLYCKNLNVSMLSNKSSCGAIIIEGNIPETEASVNRLTNLMTGREISITHPSFQDKLYVKNLLPFVFITENHEKYIKLKNIYGAKGIIISTKEIFPDTIENADWFQSVFAAFGEKHLKKCPPNFSLPKVTESDIFDAFVNEICILDDDAICAKSDLFEAYSLFYKKYYGNEQLGQRKFGKRFACYGNFEEVRPHHSRTEEYRRCFKGISIDPLKYQDFKKNMNVSKYSCTLEAFEKILHEFVKN